jgi:hypothetical protein
MRPKEKLNQILNHCENVHGIENAKEHALKTIEQILFLAPIEEKNYWYKIKNELLIFKSE